MANTKFTFSRHQLKFKRPFGISKLVRTHQEVLRVKLERDGLVGWGETSAIPYYGLSVDGFLSIIENVQTDISNASWGTPAAFYQILLQYLPNDSFLRAAFDGAAWDWYAQKMERPIWSLLYLPDPAAASRSNFTIGLATPKEMAEQISEFSWPIYKLKLGGTEDIEIMRQVCQQTSAKLRIDANAAWTPTQTKAFIDTCQLFVGDQLELIEEPFLDVTAAGVTAVAKSTDIPFFADESFQNENQLEKLREIFRGVNIKLDKCGGITPAVQLIAKARAMDYQIQLGCMSASGIALKPAIQLSGAVEVVDLDSVLILEGEEFGVYYEDGVAKCR